jgi:hypothetical protein
MAKIRILGNDELVESLTTKFRESEEKHKRIRLEWDACKSIYQGVNLQNQGGLDTGLVTSAVFAPSETSQEPIIFQGLELVKANLFLHAKLCITDPVVTARPRNQDPKSERAAQNAELYLPWMSQHTSMQEVVEFGAYLNCTVLGTGITYYGWDSNGGEYPLTEIPDNIESLKDFDFKMEGDLDLEDVNPYDFRIDGNAKSWRTAQHCFWANDVPIEEALFRFTDEEAQELLQSEYRNCTDSTQGSAKEERKGTIRIWEYWEKGMPWNGMLGMHVYFIDSTSPKILLREAHPYRHKKLPFAVMTDVDIPDNPWGMSRIIYAHQCQKSIDMLMGLFLNNTSLFGGVRMMMAEGSMNEDSINNDTATVDYYNGASGQKPEYFRPVPVTSDVWRGYTLMKTAIDNLYGMSEFSQGQIPRELSSFAVQLALEMDDKYRVRLFNKKKQYLKDIYLQGLDLTQQFMTEPRKLSVTGVEGWKDGEYFSSAVLNGDYEIMVDYGQYIPVDPAARKQQILEFLKSGFYEKAGGNMQKIAKLLVDGTMLDVKDMFERATKIQEREIDSIIEGKDVPVMKWDKDEAHISAIDDFTSTETFRSLDPEIQEAIWQHGQAHTDALAQKMAQSGGGSPGGGAPAAGGPQTAPGGLPPAGPETGGAGVPTGAAGPGSGPAELGGGPSPGNPPAPSPVNQAMNPGITPQ